MVGFELFLSVNHSRLTLCSLPHFTTEMGSFRIEMGKNILGIEEKCTWVTPATFTTINYPCDEDGANCGPTTETYVDPSDDMTSVQVRLESYKKERMSVK